MRFRRLFQLIGRRPDPADEVADELQFHLDRQVEDLVRGGWTREAASGEALRRFGDPGRYRKALVRMDHWAARRHSARDWLAGLATDLRVAARSLR